MTLWKLFCLLRQKQYWSACVAARQLLDWWSVVNLNLNLLTNSQWRQAKAWRAHWHAKTNTDEKMTHIHTNKTVPTENVSKREVILKGCISGQKQTRLSKQVQWRTSRQFRVSEENYFDQFSFIQCSKLRVGKHIFLGENLRDICKQHSAWCTGGRTLKQHVNFSLNSTTLTDLIVAAIYRIYSR